VNALDAGALGPTLLGGLGVAFAAAGTFKLRRPEVAAAAVQSFGLLTRPGRSVGVAAGAAELALAAACVAGALGAVDTRAVAIVAAVVLVALATVIARSLRAGQTFTCACFGPNDELSGTTLARALALTAVALAGALLGGSRPATVGWAFVVLGGTGLLTTVWGIRRLVGMNPDPLGQRDDLWQTRAYAVRSDA
jgi:hypothetical protein